MKKPYTKLVLVSVSYRGTLVSAFVNAIIDENGSAIVSEDFIQKMTRGIPNGQTFTMG